MKQSQFGLVEEISTLDGSEEMTIVSVLVIYFVATMHLFSPLFC